MPPGGGGMAAARGGSALASTSGALTPAQIGNPGKQIAAVFMLKNVADACIVDRIIAFHNSAGLDATWALVDEKKIDEAGMSQLGAAGVRVAPQPRVPKRWLSFGGKRSGSSKPSFVAWLAHQPAYSHAWHLEDDTFYTGAWRNLVHSARWAGVDVVASLDHPTFESWQRLPNCCECRLSGGRRCEEGNNRTSVTKVAWPIARFSRKFVLHLAAALDDGASGHHEILTGAVCDELSDSSNACVSKEFDHDDLGAYELGGWGDYQCMRRTLSDTDRYRFHKPEEGGAFLLECEKFVSIAGADEDGGSMDSWCAENCAAGNCNEVLCKCEIPARGQQQQQPQQQQQQQKKKKKRQQKQQKQQQMQQQMQQGEEDEDEDEDDAGDEEAEAEPCESSWPPSVEEATKAQWGRLYHPVKCYQKTTFGELQREWSSDPPPPTPPPSSPSPPLPPSPLPPPLMPPPMPPPTPPIPPPTPPTPGCKDWCYTNLLFVVKPWSHRCAWDHCFDCAECFVPPPQTPPLVPPLMPPLVPPLMPPPMPPMPPMPPAPACADWCFKFFKSEGGSQTCAKPKCGGCEHCAETATSQTPLPICADWCSKFFKSEGGSQTCAKPKCSGCDHCGETVTVYPVKAPVRDSLSGGKEY